MKRVFTLSLAFIVPILFSNTIFPHEKEDESKNLTYAVFPYEFVSDPSTQNVKFPEILRDAFLDKLKLDGYKLVIAEMIDSVLRNQNAGALGQEEIVKIGKSLNADVAIHFAIQIRSDKRNINSDFFDIFVYAIDVHTGKLIWFDTFSGFFNLLNSDDTTMRIAWDFVNSLKTRGY